MTEPVVVMDPNIKIDPKAATPELVEVKIGDKTFKLDKAAAEAVQASEVANAKALSDAAATVQALENKVKGDTPTVTKVGGDLKDDDYNQLFINPKVFLERVLTEHGNKIKADIVAAYTQTTAQQQFWTAFYEKHADLKAHDFYVKAVLQREYETYRPLKVEQVIDKLGETVKSELLKLGGKPGDLKRPATEGGTETLVPGSKPDSESLLTEAPKSLSAVLRARKEARRQARSLKLQETSA